VSEEPRTIRIRVRLFAMQRQQTGLRDLVLRLPPPVTVERAWEALVEHHPVLSSAGSSVRFARNGTYVDPTETLEDGDELACIPPVAGGADGDTTGTRQSGHDSRSRHGSRSRRIELHAAPFDDALLGDLRDELAGPEDGAVVVFVGQTRETPGTPAPGQEEEAARHAGAPVVALDYEAFEPMALAVLEAIADEIEARFGVRRIAILHRTGEVPVGEGSVVIVAAAPHRGQAFDACRYAIEELKARVPIWKAERFADGSVWMGAPARSGPEEEPPPAR
jgi:MoaE-MoaD fusion protein